jgi:hypothetical protein
MSFIAIKSKCIKIHFFYINVCGGGRLAGEASQTAPSTNEKHKMKGHLFSEEFCQNIQDVQNGCRTDEVRKEYAQTDL